MSDEPRVAEVGSGSRLSNRSSILALGLIGIGVTLIAWNPRLHLISWWLMGWGAGLLLQYRLSVKRITAVSWGMVALGFVILLIYLAPLHFGYTEFNYRERIRLSDILFEIAAAVLWSGFGLSMVRNERWGWWRGRGAKGSDGSMTTTSNTL